MYIVTLVVKPLKSKLTSNFRDRVFLGHTSPYNLHCNDGKERQSGTKNPRELTH